MGCSRSAISDDEDDWSKLQNRLKVREYNWGVYSRERDYAIELNREFGLTGQILYLAVGKRKYIAEMHNNIRAAENEIKDLAELFKANFT